MVKFTGEKNGKQVVGLGLSEGNLGKLREGKPILVDLSEMIPGSTMEILIFYGATERAMYEELKPALRNVPIYDFKETQ